MAKAVIALGSNLGDRFLALDEAEKALAALPNTRLLKSAKRRETAPVDVPEAFVHLRFLNSAVLIETTLSPLELLHALHKIEAEAGRVRTVRNGPRPIDLDIICYEGVTLSTSELTLPHPRAKERPFVMDPLHDLGVSLD